MIVTEFFNMILEPFLGSDVNFIMSVDTLYTTMYNSINADNWTALFAPQIFCSALLYIGLFIALWQILFIFPYRVIKKLISYPSRKSSEK